MLRRLILLLAALAGAGYAGYRFVLAPWWRSWGVVPEEVCERCADLWGRAPSTTG